MIWPLPDLLAGLGVGLVGGVTSGLLGVSPGGGLVVSANLLLGVRTARRARHLAIRPNSPHGTLRGQTLLGKGRPDASELVRSPRRRLHLRRRRGSVGGGKRLEFFLALELCSLPRWLGRPADFAADPPTTRGDASGISVGPVPWPALSGVGFLAGFSSGFLGIGGGLAITAGLSAGLRVPQHQAQLVSLVFSIIPTTIPAAWIYWRNGWSAPWLLIAGVVVGLWAGTDFGARMANRVR